MVNALQTQAVELKPAENRGVWQRLMKIASARFALAMIACLCLLALLSLAGFPFTHYLYSETSDAILAGPSASHLMGTDELGRDLLTRIIYGSRLSISIGLITAFLAFLFGTTYGAIAGSVGPALSGTMMRAIDIVYALPDLLVMILVGVLIGRGTTGILIALGLVSWMGTARLVQAQFLQLKQEEFVEAATASGVSPLAIVLRHLLPNAIGPIIVSLTFTVPSAILAESTLSFIGLGLSPPACSWGTLANDGFRSLRTDPHLIFFPSLFIFFTVLSFNFLGDGLRDALDPRTRL